MSKTMVVILSDNSDNPEMVFPINDKTGGTRLWEQLEQYDEEHEPSVRVEYFTDEQLKEAERIGNEMA